MLESQKRESRKEEIMRKRIIEIIHAFIGFTGFLLLGSESESMTAFVLSKLVGALMLIGAYLLFKMNHIELSSYEEN